MTSGCVPHAHSERTCRRWVPFPPGEGPVPLGCTNAVQQRVYFNCEARHVRRYRRCWRKAPSAGRTKRGLSAKHRRRQAEARGAARVARSGIVGTALGQNSESGGALAAAV